MPWISCLPQPVPQKVETVKQIFFDGQMSSQQKTPRCRGFLVMVLFRLGPYRHETWLTI